MTEDDAALGGIDDITEERKTPVSIQKSLLRKAVPETARSSLDLDGPTNQLPGSQAPIFSPPKRKPVAELSSQVEQIDISNDYTPPRRPLGPRSLVKGKVGLERKHLPGAENVPLQPTPQDKSDFTVVQPSTNQITIPKEPASSLPDAISIMLIRRDPSSRAQWNIGTISGHPISENVQSGRGVATRRLKKPYFDMSIHISSPGYASFRTAPETAYTDMRDNSETESIRSHVPSSGTFDRELRMEGSSFWNRSGMQHKRTSSDISDGHNIAHGRSLSNSSISVEVPHSRPIEGVQSAKKLESEGYIFFSPWGGRCKFSTGGGGRSLLCKHTLPIPLSTRDVGEGSTGRESAVVSELRFNLPSINLFGSSKSHGTKEKDSVDSRHFRLPSIGHIREKLSAHKPQPKPFQPHPTSYVAMYPSDEETPLPLPPQSSSAAAIRSAYQRPPYSSRTGSSMKGEADEFEEESRLDLSIGQEKAGGGNRGKRAKLGKLIIHDEGFKMLDLVVAANMGIWWSIWEPDQ